MTQEKCLNKTIPIWCKRKINRRGGGLKEPHDYEKTGCIGRKIILGIVKFYKCVLLFKN